MKSALNEQKKNPLRSVQGQKVTNHSEWHIVLRLLLKYLKKNQFPYNNLRSRINDWSCMKLIPKFLTTEERLNWFLRSRTHPIDYGKGITKKHFNKIWYNWIFLNYDILGSIQNWLLQIVKLVPNLFIYWRLLLLV